MQLKLLKLGCRPFAEALEIQNQLWAEIVEQPAPTTGWIIVTEHPPVITYGKREKGDSLRLSKEEIHRRGVEIVAINRGGLATVHTPGQLIVYFIVPMRAWRLRVKSFIEILEKSMAATCIHFGVDAYAGSTVGIPVGAWVGKKKIGQIGISIHRGVSQHGLALNVHNDLRYFDLIDPCGLPDVMPTSIQQALMQKSPSLKSPSLSNVADQLIDELRNNFQGLSDVLVK